MPANLAIGASFIVVTHRAGLSWTKLGLGRADVPRGLLIGLFAAIGIGVVIGIALAIPATRTFFESDAVADDDTASRWFVPLVRIPLGTAVYEELLFRAALFGLFLRLRGLITAIVGTSVLFGLWHIVPTLETTSGSALSIAGAVVGAVLFTGLAGVLFAGLRYWSRSVIAPILAHTASNSLAYAAALIALGLGD